MKMWGYFGTLLVSLFLVTWGIQSLRGEPLVLTFDAVSPWVANLFFILAGVVAMAAAPLLFRRALSWLWGLRNDDSGLNLDIQTRGETQVETAQMVRRRAGKGNGRK